MYALSITLSVNVLLILAMTFLVNHTLYGLKLHNSKNGMYMPPTILLNALNYK